MTKSQLETRMHELALEIEEASKCDAPDEVEALLKEQDEIGNKLMLDLMHG